MNITLVSDSLPDLLPMRDRSPGYHVSDAIRSLCIAYGYYDEETEVDNDPNPSRRTLMMMGKAFEYALIQMLQKEEPDRYLEIGEIFKDGIPGTPDLFDLCLPGPKEFKFTLRSVYSTIPCIVGESAPNDHPIHSNIFWRDWTQVKCYCIMTGCNLGSLEMLHGRGDYRKLAVAHRSWLGEFKERELVETWLTCRSEIRRMEKEKGIK